MTDLRETLARMLSVHLHKVQWTGEHRHTPTGIEYTLTYASLPPSPSIPTQPKREYVGDAPLRPTLLTDPTIIASYNRSARAIIRADTEHNEIASITWHDLAKRKDIRHVRS